jgi:hypothetical protein
MSTLLGWKQLQRPFSPKTLYKWINMGEIARHENVHHPGRKIVIHGPRSKRWSCGEVRCLARLESDHGRLLMTFQYRGRRCREYVGLNDTRENRRTAAGIVREIELAITSAKFDYQACFPARRNLERLGLQSVAKPENPTSPTLGGFATKWLEQWRAQLSAATRRSSLQVGRFSLWHSECGNTLLPVREFIDDQNGPRNIWTEDHE